MPTFQGLVSEEQLHAAHRVREVAGRRRRRAGAAVAPGRGSRAIATTGTARGHWRGRIQDQDVTATRTHYLNDGYGLKSWLLTLDHKRIALLYLVSITVFFVVGGVFAVLIRLELLTPAGDLGRADTYNKLFTLHGVDDGVLLPDPVDSRRRSATSSCR